ncbi:hypothetical protein SNE40_020037 [Patella caerulea]|uniref:QRICH1-like domain-containing protein n=1 Tax=Patella caerulea TaxID=87958 RepID=A0AAN8G1Z6_PATCE
MQNNHDNEERKITKDLEHIDSIDLNVWLKHFVVEVRKKDGEKYPPNSIFLMSYLSLNCKKNLDILKNGEFVEFCQVLDGQKKQLNKIYLQCLLNMTSSGGGGYGISSQG